MSIHAAAAKAGVAGAGFEPSTCPNAWPVPSTAAATPTWFISPIPPRPSAPLPLCAEGDEVQIHFLMDVPEHVPNVARALFAEWTDVYTNYFHLTTLPEVEQNIREAYFHKDQLGYVLVATVQGEFAGTVTMTCDDTVAGHPYYGTKPWMTCLWCEPQFRRRGIANKLFTSLCNQAEAWGYRSLWLITEDQQKLYSKNGWKEIETLPVWSPRTFTVMRRDFKTLDVSPPFVNRKTEATPAAASPTQ